MIDKQTLLERADLLTLAEHDSQLRKVATTGGGEWCGPCPFCGGVDRFRVQPYKQPWALWMCRHCTGGKWKNAIDYVIASDNSDYKQACEILADGDLPRTTTTRRAAPEIPAYNAPAKDWQAQALRAVEICAGKLRQPMGDPALAYLRSRGIRDESIDYFRLGWSPGADFGGLYIRRGVVIPCIVAGEAWYIKISLLPGDPVKCEKCGKQAQARKPCPRCSAVNKYRGVKGNRTAAIYNAEDLIGAEIGLYCEGEIDCIIAWQELRDVAGVVTMGSATNRLDLATWGAYLMPLRAILLTYDSDQAGKAGAAALVELTDLAKLCPLPEGAKDINDYYLVGGDLWEWFKYHLNRLNVLAELGVSFG